MKRLAIITTHPIQYYAPVFRMLHERRNVEIHVFYTAGEAGKYDRGFEKEITWDIPLLEGYPYTFLQNTAKEKGSHHFMGVKNPGLINQVAHFNPDAILVYGWAYISHLQLMRHFKGQVPVWFRGDSTLIDKLPYWKKLLRTFFLRWVYKHVDSAFYAGTFNKEYFLEHGLKNEQLIFAPHAIDNERFAENREVEAQSVRAKLGIAEEDILILFTGKFEAKKSPLQLVEAFIALNHPGTHLLLIGDGLLSADIRNKIYNEKSIHLLPFVNQTDIPVYYQACNLFCLPSGGPGESWGLAVNEAMAAGRAVLVSDKAGCAPDLVEQDVTGRIFSYEHPGSLLSNLSNLVADKPKLHAMGKHAAGKIKNNSFIIQVLAFESAF